MEAKLMICCWQVSKPTGVLVVERARYLLQLNKEQVAAFEDKTKEIAGAGGWVPAAQGDVAKWADESHAADLCVTFKRAQC